MRHRPIGVVLAVCSTVMAMLSVGGGCSSAAAQEPEDGRRGALVGDSVPLQTDDLPKRPRLLLELGEHLLNSGPLSRGIRLPTGAVWRPALWVFGRYRSSVQSFDNGLSEDGEWAQRFDVFANLRLTGTERVLIGFRPADEFGGVGYNFGSTVDNGWQDDFNGQIETLFFEGELGELFPFLDDDDSGSLDIGFSVGRQDLSIQEGILIGDNIDVVGVTRNNLRPPGTSNLRITGLFGWNGIHRNNVEDGSARLLALLTEVDFPFSTITLDAVYTIADDTTGDAFYGGVGAVQRIGQLNTAFRVNVFGTRHRQHDGGNPRCGVLERNLLDARAHGESVLREQLLGRRGVRAGREGPGRAAGASRHLVRVGRNGPLWISAEQSGRRRGWRRLRSSKVLC